MKKYILFIFIIAPMLTLAQGPAGVGSSANNLIWLDAGELNLSNNDKVASWGDISGNGNDATNGSTTAQPTYKASAINGLPAVVFDESNSQELTCNIGATGSPMSVFVVGYFNNDQASGNSDYFMSLGQWAGNAMISVGRRGNATAGEDECYYCFNGGASLYGPALPTATYTLVEAVHESGSAPRHKLWYDGASQAVADYGTDIATNGDFYVGSFVSTNHYLDGEIAELIFFNTALNAAERTVVENYLNQKYGIAIANDYYTGGSFDENVIGIGTTDGTVKHSASTGNGGALYLSEAAGMGAAGEFIFAGHDGTPHSVTLANIAVANTGRWSREYYLEKTGALGATIGFDLVEAGFSAPTAVGDFKLLYRANTSSDFTQVTATAALNGNKVEFTVTDANLATGYYTLGIPEFKTWYSMVTGNWDDANTWTLDPSGALVNNPSSLTPTTSPTAEYDKVVIRNSKTVTIQPGNNNKTNASVEVNGRLDLTTTTGHDFGIIRGSGRIKLNGDNFPSGDKTHFITAGQGEGTVVYYGTGYDLATASEFYSMEVNMDNATDELVLLADYQLNGNLNVEQGILKINDNSTTTALSLSIDGDLYTQTDGQIQTGTGNAAHSLYLKGDVTLEGVMRLCNLSTYSYTSTPTSGYVEAYFTSDHENQLVQCSDTAVFYRIIVDKGTDMTYYAHFQADDPDFFLLYGRIDQAATGTHPDLIQNRALSIWAGTARMGNNITIPRLYMNNDFYTLDTDARLWIDGTSDINVFDDAIRVAGKVQVSGFGTFTAPGYDGISIRETGIVQVDGGTLNASIIKTSRGGGGTHYGSYIQSGGTVNVGDGTNGPTRYYRFMLPFDDNSFTMSGGTLNVRYPHSGGEADGGGFLVNANDANVNVTGGTVNFTSDRGGVDFEIISSAPFWDLNLINTGGGDFLLTSYTSSVDPPFIGTINAKPLKVLDDLDIDGNSTLDANGQDVEIGGNLDMANGGSYVHGNNTTRFNQGQRSYIYVRNTTNANELEFYNLEIYKDQRWNTSLFHAVIVNSNGRTQNPADAANHVINIANDFDIIRGEFNTWNFSVDLKGNLEITDGQILADNPDPGRMVLNGSLAQTVKGSLTAEQDFGHIELDNAAGASLLSDINVSDFTLTDGVMDLGQYNLDVTGELYGTFSSAEMFSTAGDASNGGITHYVDADAAYTYPIGTGGAYTPVTVTVSNYVDDGRIQISVSDQELALLDPASGDDALQYYWRVRHEDFGTLPDVQTDYSYDQTDVDLTNGGTEADYRAGKVVNATRLPKSTDADIGSINTTTNVISFNLNALEEGYFTAGDASKFDNDIFIYYTRDNAEQADWKTNATWTRSDILIDANGDLVIDEKDWHDNRQPAAGSWPSAGDIAVIGWVPWDDPDVAERGMPHSARLNGGGLTVAEIWFTQMKDAGGNPTGRVYRNNFQFRPTFTINSGGALDIGLIKGEGMVRDRDTDADLTNCDMGDFNSEDSAYFLYECFNDVTLANAPSEFPNLAIASDGWGAQDRDVTFPGDVLVNGTFEIMGNTNLLLDNDADGDFVIMEDLWLNEATIGTGGGELAFQNNGTARDLTVYGDIRFTGDDMLMHVRSPNNTPAVYHNINLFGSIIQNTAGTTDGMQLWSATGEDAVTLTILGETNESMTITAGNAATFYRIVMNKRVDRDFDFLDPMTLNGPTDGDPKALELISGDINFNDAAIDITLSSGNEDFYIPADASLLASNATMRVTGNNTGIKLDGYLRVGWASDWLINGGTNNYIEYGATGSAQLYVYQGTLRIGGQLRRDEYTEAGVIDFRQEHSNSTIIIGENDATENGRGVFEVLNAGSYFGQVAGAEIQIVRQQDNPTFPALYLDPDNSLLEDGSIIRLGNGSTPANQVIEVQTYIDLKDVIVDNTSTNSPEVKLQVNNTTIDGDLEIESGATFNANALDLTVNGDFTNNGTYSPVGNTTYLNGTATQNVTGNTTFYNLSMQTANTINLVAASADITVENLLSIEAGSLTDNSNTITVLGNLHNEGTHVWGGSNDGMLMQGNGLQQITGTGTYGRLTINNYDGVEVPDGNNLTITDDLKLNGGVFNIGTNLLILGETTTITEATTFSASNMIQSGFSYLHSGVQKTFPAGASSFFIPIGSTGKYTPVDFTVTANGNNTGSITVRPLDEVHPSIINDAEAPDPELTDVDNVLQYYWRLKANGMSGFSGSVVMTHDAGDAPAASASYTTADYITAKLLGDGSGNWAKYTTADYDQATYECTFTFAGVDDVGIDADYTAGVDGSTFNGAIPDVVPVYTSNSDGDWDQVGIWTPVAPAGGPNGAIVIINDDVTLNNDGARSYQTIINDPGRMLVNTTVGHRMGSIEGDGTVYIERGDIPTADYTDFFANNGGTIEFGGSTDYDVLSGISYVNNLTFSGTGERRLPNLELTVHGNLTINGGDVINEYDETINIEEDFDFSGGSFDAGIGADATIAMTGTTNQSIIGNLTGVNALNNLSINTTGNDVILHDAVDVDGILTLTDGVLDSRTHAAGLLLTNLATVSGGSEASFVEGEMQKYLQAATDFTFPTGQGSWWGRIAVINPTATATWTARYFSSNPKDPSSMEASLDQIDAIEHWSLANYDGADTYVRLYWDGQTAVSSNSADYGELRVAEWNGTDTWLNRGQTAWWGTEPEGYVTSGNLITFSEKFFTLGSTTDDNPLPVDVISLKVEDEKGRAKVLWQTASEYNSDYFDVERSADGYNFAYVGRVNAAGSSNELLDYHLIDSDPLPEISYYRLKLVNYDGTVEYIGPVAYANNETDESKAFTVRFYPNPVANGQIQFEAGNVKSEVVTVKIYNQQGVLMDIRELAAGYVDQISESINLNLTGGIYFMTVESGGQLVQKKLVVL